MIGHEINPVGEIVNINGQPFTIVGMFEHYQSEADKKIGLSLKAVAEDEERTRLEDYQRQATAATMTMEEAMNFREERESN